ncbi:T9SS type A sorting domain-containing protein [bacterium]|nr:T9SS type A sorting domain-containing protein [bacterium]
MRGIPRPCRQRAEEELIHGQLVIYDALGREVYRRSVNPGAREILCSTDAVPSGLYFYRFSSSDLTVSNKLVTLGTSLFVIARTVELVRGRMKLRRATEMGQSHMWHNPRIHL